MTRFGHKLNYVINTFVKRTPGGFNVIYMLVKVLSLYHDFLKFNGNTYGICSVRHSVVSVTEIAVRGLSYSFLIGSS